MSKIYTLYTLGLIALILFGYPIQTNANEITSSKDNPVKIIDGDSLEIGNERIRLIGIDAPEYLQYCKNKKNKRYDCGKVSTSHLKNIIADNNIHCTIHSKDKYDRNLCTCYADKININAEMVRSGYAVIYLDDKYTKEQNEAKANKRGIWRGKFIQPRLFRRLQEYKNQN